MRHIYEWIMHPRTDQQKQWDYDHDKQYGWSSPDWTANFESKNEMKSLEEYVEEYLPRELKFSKNICDETFYDFVKDNQIKKITENTHKLYINFNFNRCEYLGFGCWDESQYDQYQRMTYKNLFHSSKVSDIGMDIAKNFNKDISKIHAETQQDKIGLLFVYTDNYQKLLDDDKFKQILSYHNYYLQKYNSDNRCLVLHPWKPIDCSEKIFSKYDGIVYHATSEWSWNFIKTDGLVPKGKKSRNDYQPKRIYLTTNPTDAKIMFRQIQQVKTFNNSKHEKDIAPYQTVLPKEQYKEATEKCVLLKIDLSKYEYKYKIWSDPASIGYDAYFTCEYIPPMIIEKVD